MAPLDDCVSVRLRAVVARGQAESSSYLPLPLVEGSHEDAVQRRFWTPHELAEMDGHD